MTDRFGGECLCLADPCPICGGSGYDGNCFPQSPKRPFRKREKKDEEAAMLKVIEVINRKTKMPAGELDETPTGKTQ